MGDLVANQPARSCDTYETIEKSHGCIEPLKKSAVKLKTLP